MFQFSLKTILTSMLIVALIAAWWVNLPLTFDTRDKKGDWLRIGDRVSFVGAFRWNENGTILGFEATRLPGQVRPTISAQVRIDDGNGMYVTKEVGLLWKLVDK